MSLYQDHSYGITTIDTHYVRPRLAASHLVVENGQAAFIDVGTTLSVPHLLSALQQKGLTPEQVAYIIVTHVHLDHAGGSGALLAHCPQAKLVVHSRGVKHLIDPSVLMQSALQVYGEELLLSRCGMMQPAPAERIIVINDGDTLSLQGRELLFLDTPGHARHHFCVFDARSQSFFTGDTFGISYREFDSEQGAFIFITTTPVQLEPAAWHQTLDRLMSYEPQMMYLTHYGAVSDVTRLADELHISLDIHVDLVRQYASQPNCKAQLTEAITQLLATKASQHSGLNYAVCRDLLTMDAELNAQGLLVWWEKQQQQRVVK